MHDGITKKGQSSLEQLIVISIGIAAITAVFYFSMNFSSDSIRVSQAQDMVEKLAKSSDYVYSLGPGSKDVVDIYIPEGIVFTNITNSTVWVRLSLTSGLSDVFADTKPVLIGELPVTPGPHEISVTHTESGKVLLGEGLLYCSPFVITRSFLQGENGSDSITVKNVGGYRLENVSAGLEGNILDLTMLTQPAGTLEPEESSTAGLIFSIPGNKEPDSYSGSVTVTADVVGNTTKKAECSTFVTIFVVSSTPPDNAGPIVISIGHQPRNPSIFSPVKIKATGDDSSTGGSAIENCQLELDGSGIWNDMAPIDGAYDEVTEGVEYAMGPLGEGFHYVSVRCIDEYFNVGPERKDNFTVRVYKKEILFITVASAPEPGEQLWIDWIDSQASGEGYAWNYDVVPRSNITGGTVDPADYQIVAFANYPNTDTALDSRMTAYRNTAHYIVLLGESMKFGIPNLGVGSGNAGVHARNALKVQTDHYITDGYDIHTIYNITEGEWGVHYHPSFEAMNILSMDEMDERIVVGDASYVITYGPIRPDMFTTDGDIFGGRIIDYALLNS